MTVFINLKEFYECWKNANLPPITTDLLDVASLEKTLGIIQENLALREDKLSLRIQDGRIFFYYGFASVLTYPEYFTRSQLAEYFSCFEMKGLLKKFYKDMLCRIPENGRIMGGTPGFYYITIDGEGFIMNEVNTYAKPVVEDITERAAKYGIAPRIFRKKRCGDEVIFIQEPISRPLQGSNLPTKELPNMVVQVYELIKGLKSAGICLPVINLSDIVWTDGKDGNVYKICDFYSAELKSFSLTLLFTSFIARLGFGDSASTPLSFSRWGSHHHPTLPPPEEYHKTSLYCLGGEDVYLTFDQRKAILKGVEKCGMKAIFSDFDAHLRYVDISSSDQKRMKERLDVLVEEGAVLFPVKEKLDPEFYYINRVITKRLISLKQRYLVPNRDFYAHGFYATYVYPIKNAPSHVSKRAIVLKNHNLHLLKLYHQIIPDEPKPFVESLDDIVLIDLSNNDFWVKRSKGVVDDTLKERLKSLKAFWNLGYSYGSDIFLSTLLIDFSNSKSNPSPKDMANDLKLLLKDSKVSPDLLVDIPAEILSELKSK